MNISDEIANLILQILEDSHGTANIQRNELATQIGCVPSAINYVITSRFTPQQGYIVESRRGGGGYIRITQVCSDRPSVIMHVVNGIGQNIDERTCRVITQDLYYRHLLSEDAVKIISAALSERVLSDAPANVRENVRASVFKAALMSTL